MFIIVTKLIYLLDWQSNSMKKQRRNEDIMAKKVKKLDLEKLTEEEKLKYEVAEELGLLNRVLEQGWRSLSAKETGRIGGIVSKRKQKNPQDALNET